MYLVIANGIRTGDPLEFNKGCSLKFHQGSQAWQTPEEGSRTYQPKHCGNNYKDEDNSQKTLNDKHQVSSQKFSQLREIDGELLMVIKAKNEQFRCSFLFNSLSTFMGYSLLKFDSFGKVWLQS